MAELPAHGPYAEFALLLFISALAGALAVRLRQPVLIAYIVVGLKLDLHHIRGNGHQPRPSRCRGAAARRGALGGDYLSAVGLQPRLPARARRGRLQGAHRGVGTDLSAAPAPDAVAGAAAATPHAAAGSAPTAPTRPQETER